MLQQNSKKKLLINDIFLKLTDELPAYNKVIIPDSIIKYSIKQLIGDLELRHQIKLGGYIYQRVLSKLLHSTFTGQHWLAKCLLFDGKCLEMVKILENLIQKGHTQSMADLAQILAQGIDDIHADHERMDQLLKLGMSKMCVDCMGVKASRNFNWNLRRYNMDLGECFKLAKESASKGSKYGLYAFGCVLLPDYGKEEIQTNAIEAYKCFELAAEKGHPGALYKLGMAHYLGQYGYPMDKKKSFEFYRQASMCGDASTMALVGQMLYEGEGVATNFDQAIWWLRRAVNARVCYADCHLKRALSLKHACTVDDTNAHMKHKN